MDDILKWSFQTGGAVGGSPAVSNGTVFVGSDDFHLYAIDGATGMLRWSMKTAGAVTS